MAIEQAQGGATRMEASGDATGLAAQSQGQSYEQITEFLKEKGAPEPEPEAPEAEEPEPAAEPEKPVAEAPTVEEYYRLTEEQLNGLPPEVQSHLKRVHKDFQAAFTKKTQALAEERRQLEARAQQQQHVPVPPPVPQAPPQPAAVRVPPEYVENRRQTLPAEMQWMAESLALGDYQRDVAFQQRYIAPIASTLTAQQQAAMQASYASVQEEMDAKNPGWQAHEEEMVDIVKFLQSKDLKHPKWGNKLDLIYRLANGTPTQQQAVQGALERTAQAVRSKSTVSGTAGRTTVPDTAERIRSAKSDTDAWAAVQAAVTGGKR